MSYGISKEGYEIKKRKYFEKLKSIQWAFKLAWEIDRRMLLLWMTLSIGVSVLPAISLIFQNRIVDMLSRFLAGEAQIAFPLIVPQILAFGVTMILIGVSARVNSDLIYMMMYDSYYLGMEELLMDHLQKIEIKDLLKREVNDEYNYIVGRAGSLTDIMSGACVLVGKIVSIASLLGVAARSSGFVFWISLLYVCGIFWVNFYFVEKVRWDTSEYRKIARASDYYENIPVDPGTAKEIRVFEMADFVVKQWKCAFSAVKQYEKKRDFEIELRNLISGIGFYLFMFLMICVNLFRLAQGRMQVGVFLMLFNLCLNIYTAISGLARDIMSFDYGLFALNRQRKFMSAALQQRKTTFEGAETDGNSDSVFCVKDMSFSYDGTNAALKDISFEVKAGEIVALVGANGSGKTTLTKILLGMYRPDSGSLSLCGIPYSAYTPQQIREKIGVFFQDFFLFHATIGENVAYGDIDHRTEEDRIMKALHKGGADRVVEKLRDGIDSVIGRQVYRSGVELSGGERQRIGVARAHMSDKNIVIFDEPASALDPVAEAEQFLHIREKMEGRTAVLVSHRIGFCRLADKIIMLENGRIAEIGRHEELIAKQGVYAAFYREQAEWYDESGEGGV